MPHITHQECDGVTAYAVMPSSRHIRVAWFLLEDAQVAAI